MQIPSSYQPGYEEALLTDPDLAKTYIQHTLIGDPDADALINAISDIDHEQQGEFIRAGMDLDEEKLRDAPQGMREFFEKIGTPPAWFDPQSVYPGCRGFHAYSDLFLTAFVADIIIRGFTTLISQSFFTTGRLTDWGVRLRQNIRHLLEIMLPGGLGRQGEGWKLSVRLRLVHAQVRRHILNSEDWDYEAQGMPINAAHWYASCRMMLSSAAKIMARSI